VADGGSALWWIKLRQRGVPVEAGSSYAVSVRLKASAPRRVRLKVSVGWSTVLGEQLCDVAEAFTTCSVALEGVAQSGTGMLNLLMGKFAGTLTLDSAVWAQV